MSSGSLTRSDHYMVSVSAPPKTNYMSEEAFVGLKEALDSALAYENGERPDLHVTRIKARRLPKAKSSKDRQASDHNRWRDYGAMACSDVAGCSEL